MYIWGDMVCLGEPRDAAKRCKPREVEIACRINKNEELQEMGSGETRRHLCLVFHLIVDSELIKFNAKNQTKA